MSLPALSRFSASQAATLALLAALSLPVVLRAEEAKGAANAAGAGNTAEAAKAAEAQPPAVEALQSEASPTLDDLDQKLRILERKLEVKDEAEATAKEQNATVTAGKDGFSLIAADKESLLKFKFFQHTDGRYFFADGANKLPNTLLLRRVRPVLEGTLGKYYNFRLQPDFGAAVSVLDAYGEAAYWPSARLRIGKSKTPLGLERIQSSQDMNVIEFAHPTSLTPNYDLGISLLGDFREEAYGYNVGVFNGAVDGANRDVDLNDDKDLIGRVFALPFKNGAVEPLRGLGIGFAASWGKRRGDSANSELPAYRTEGQQTFYTSRTVATRAPAATYNAATQVVGNSAAISSDTGTVRANGDLIRINPQGYWYYGPFGLLGEYISSAQEVSKGGANLGKQATLTTRAWQATASWVVTGEATSFKSFKPRHPVSFADGEKSGFGAWELVARYSRLDVDAAAFPLYANPAVAARQASTWTGSLNWHLSRYARLSADYAWTEFKGGAANGADRPEEKVFFARLQTAF
jgi:phosphate-selective porin OprO and OprP